MQKLTGTVVGLGTCSTRLAHLKLWGREEDSLRYIDIRL